jgi:hypothetical protein
LSAAVGANNEIQRIMEEGHRHPSEYARMGLHNCVELTNSVSVAEMPRLATALSQYPLLLHEEKEGNHRVKVRVRGLGLEGERFRVRGL